MINMEKKIWYKKAENEGFLKQSLCFTTIFFIAFFYIFSTMCFAHKVVVFAWVDGDIVHVESKFSGGRKVVSGKIEVFDLSGNFICSGKTDNKGMFSFKIIKKTGMKIKLSAGMGHMGQWTISAEEAGALSDATKEQKNIPDLSKSPGSLCENMDSVNFVKNDEIKKIIEQTIDRKLKPVYVILSKMQNPGANINDIIGGIGYIFGFMGIILYFKSKKKDNS